MISSIDSEINSLNITYKNLLENNSLVIENENNCSQFYCDRIFKRKKGIRRAYDLFTPIQKGKNWLYETTYSYQPKTGEILLNGGDLKIVSSRPQSDSFFIPSLVQEINGRMIQVFRSFHGRNPSDDNYKLLDDRMISLPEELRAAYFHRFLGLSVIDDPVVGTGSNLLMKDIGNWGFIDTYLGRIRKKKNYLPFIEEVIPDVKPKYQHDPYFNFSCFLNVGNHQWGDVFFVKTHIRDGVIYYIRDHDIENMMILSTPIEAMDEYHAHVLTRKEGRFDFMPYASPM